MRTHFLFSFPLYLFPFACIKQYKTATLRLFFSSYSCVLCKFGLFLLPLNKKKERSTHQ